MTQNDQIIVAAIENLTRVVTNLQIFVEKLTRPELSIPRVPFMPMTDEDAYDEMLGQDARHRPIKSAPKTTSPKRKQSRVNVSDPLDVVVAHIRASMKAKRYNEKIIPQIDNDPRVWCDTRHNKLCKQYRDENGLTLKDVSAELLARLG